MRLASSQSIDRHSINNRYSNRHIGRVAAVFPQSPEHSPSNESHSIMNQSRRNMLITSVSLASSLALPSLAFEPAPTGFYRQVDKIDGYSFIYPQSWLTVTSSGNDCSLRNPRNIDENLFVSISSPSSSRYTTVNDLGSPKDAAKKLLDQYLTQEFMSTRIGISREGSVVSAVEREGADGRLYYDLTIRMTSYASRNPYVATREEVMKDYGVEWDRILLTTLGVANQRLYELRIQTAAETLASSRATIDKIKDSFTVKEVEVV